MLQIAANDLTADDIREAAGLSQTLAIPRGVAFGPFEFTGLFDYDGTTLTICDLQESDNYGAIDFKSRLKADQDNPPVYLCIEAIEVIWIDQHVLDHADPEDVRRVWEGIYLEVQDGEFTRAWPLRDGNHVEAQPVGLMDSDQATETRAYRYRVNGLATFPEGSITFDLEHLDSLKVLSTAAAAGSLLGANGDVRIKIHGVAWNKNLPKATPEAGPTSCSKDKYTAVLRNNGRKQLELRSQHAMSVSRFG